MCPSIYNLSLLQIFHGLARSKAIPIADLCRPDRPRPRAHPRTCTSNAHKCTSRSETTPDHKPQPPMLRTLVSKRPLPAALPAAALPVARQSAQASAAAVRLAFGKNRAMASSTTTNTAPTTKHEWIVILPDHSGALQRRMDARP